MTKEIICTVMNCRYNYLNHCIDDRRIIIGINGCENFQKNESERIKDITNTKTFNGDLSLKEANKRKR